MKYILYIFAFLLFAGMNYALIHYFHWSVELLLIIGLAMLEARVMMNEIISEQKKKG